MGEGLLEAALRYARRGWPVLPCHAPNDLGRCSCGYSNCSSVGKHPRLQHGLREASSDLATVERWWTRWPRANIGILTGQPSGIVVIDIDHRHGGDRTIDEFVRDHGALPRTAIVRTGDGFHVYFVHPGVRVVNDSGQSLGTGVDVRGDGGYVMAPPSVHASGRSYGVVEPFEVLAPLPDDLLRRVVKREVPAPVPIGPVHQPDNADAWARAALDGEAARVRTAPNGSRNNALNRAAFSLGQIVAGGALERRVVEQVLVESAIAVGLTEREARATISSGLRSGGERPRGPVVQSRPPSNGDSTVITFVPWPKDWEGPGFPARGEYVERCWTSVLGPTATLALRAINQEMEIAGGSVKLSLDDLARSLGVGGGTAKNAIGPRALARLEQFRVATALPDACMAIRTELPPLSVHHLRRAGATVERWHRQLLAAGGTAPILSR